MSWRSLRPALLWLATTAFAAAAVYAGYRAYESEGLKRWSWALLSVFLAVLVWRDVRILRARKP